jgi:hypothetical protein
MIISWPIPLLLIILVVVIFWAMLSSANRRRRQLQDDPLPCIGCGTLHPGYASYCRHCGRKLS